MNRFCALFSVGKRIGCLKYQSKETIRGYCSNYGQNWPVFDQIRRCGSQSSILARSFEIENVDQFKSKVLTSDIPVVVDFKADWCGPCKMLAPRLESKILARNGSVLLAKVDVDSLADLALDFDVKSVPTVLAFIDGSVVNKFVGMKNDDELDEFIDQLVETGTEREPEENEEL